MYQSTRQYAAAYRSDANGIGTSPLVGAGVGYFTPVSTTGTPGAVHLTNANRGGNGRFGLALRPATATATRTGLDTALGSISNPAHGRATLFNALG